MTREFKMKSSPLDANHLFMDIHKHKASHHKKEEDVYQKYKGYEKKISLLFSDLPKEHKFWLLDGSSVTSLHELYDAFKDMSDEVFFHHVGKGRNDFSKWVKNVYHDENLAFKLAKIKNKKQGIKIIENHTDNLLQVPGQVDDENGFFKALIKKLNSQNVKLEKDLFAKKDWLMKKQTELQSWEQKNIDYEKNLYKKFQTIDHHEKKLIQKIQKLKVEEESLNQQLLEEKKQIQLQNQEILKEKKIIENQRKEIQEKSTHIEKRSQEVDKKVQKHKEISKSILHQKFSSTYVRLDELMSYVSTCVFNKNYNEAKDAMAKVKYYYGTLPGSDPKKKEFYTKIVNLKKHINETLKV
jgi:DNA repair exonuclease SbcCD ATPase subunit